jgi:type II secretion system protein N
MIDGSSSKIVRFLKGSGWTLTSVFFLLFFTLLKLPDDRIGPWLDSKIQDQLRSQGITYSSTRSRLKFGLGLSYVLEGATVDIRGMRSSQQYAFDKVTISPSLLALLTMKVGADVRLESGKGIVDLSARLGKTSQSISFYAKDVVIGKFGVPPGGEPAPVPIDFMNPDPASIWANLKKTGVVGGSGSFSGDFSVPNTLDGKISLDLTKLVIDQQTLMGFNIPRMSISESKIEGATEKGKLIFKNVKIGKGADDLRATLTGDMTLGKSWDSSALNAKVNFAVSDTVHKAFILMDSLLAPARTPDGSFTYALSGPLSGPLQPTPMGSK